MRIWPTAPAHSCGLTHSKRLRPGSVPGAEQWAFDLARLRLAPGSWLRRRHRPGGRCAPLTTCSAVSGQRPGRGGARRNCGPRGDPVVPSSDGPAAEPFGLTGQELRIACLTATGLSNKEIGRQLQLSPRTVAAHLYKIFPKL
ncbi:response regulator transcription factor, partial [Streptomyces sp. NPDC057545]|uniref:helix-turn-helix transcriptional regulator n=1 Tax=Streptomyces sp. NPDC057545 TaxID=3346164 RepID=UPI0036CFBAF0